MGCMNCRRDLSGIKQKVGFTTKSFSSGAPEMSVWAYLIFLQSVSQMP